MMEYLAQGGRRLVCIEHHAHGFPDGVRVVEARKRDVFGAGGV
jgi:hypothetical protein